jgi:hypothetical protein
MTEIIKTDVTQERKIVTDIIMVCGEIRNLEVHINEYINNGCSKLEEENFSSHSPNGLIRILKDVKDMKLAIDDIRVASEQLENVCNRLENKSSRIFERVSQSYIKKSIEAGSI